MLFPICETCQSFTAAKIINKSFRAQTDFLLDNILLFSASLNNLSVPLGCLLSGTFAEKLGRKKSLLIVCVPFLIAFLMLHWSSQTWLILLALAIIGASGGLSETPVGLLTISLI